MRVAVLNAGGSDPDQEFTSFAGLPGDPGHAPVNFHAFAACTGGGFYRKTSSIPEEIGEVILLIRADVKGAWKTLTELKTAGKKVAISWKETGSHQLAKQLNDPGSIEWFKKLCTDAHGAIATTPESLSLYQACGAKIAEYIPTPYPVESPDWDFSVPIPNRRGIFIGTREWDVPSRNHLAAIATAATLKQPMTVFNVDGRSGRSKIAALGIDRLEVIEDRLPYAEYLSVMARHRIVWQLDSSCVPGQVAGDAALCRIPSVGGHGAVDRELFPIMTGGGRSTDMLLEIASRLLNDTRIYTSEVKVAASLARHKISFSVITERLYRFFCRLAE
ncbi:MAG: hypothetical protein RL088_1794 [Verrucomicrobiota bacterium]|jgi:hypothetical protein